MGADQDDLVAGGYLIKTRQGGRGLGDASEYKLGLNPACLVTE
jgi:hypothetical protein